MRLDDALWQLARTLHQRIQRADAKGNDVLAERLTARRQRVCGLIHDLRRREQAEERRANSGFGEMVGLRDRY